jgi:hypothetical protein
MMMSTSKPTTMPTLMPSMMPMTIHPAKPMAMPTSERMAKPSIQHLTSSLKKLSVMPWNKEQIIKEVIDGEYEEHIEESFYSFELACHFGKNIEYTQSPIPLECSGNDKLASLLWQLCQ